MSLTKLYLKAKAELGFRFNQLCNKLRRGGMLAHAYARRRGNAKAPGGLAKLWLKAPVEARDAEGTERMSGGKDNDCVTPWGAMISPVLANLRMNRFLKHWRGAGKGETFRARFVSLRRGGYAGEALAWTAPLLAEWPKISGRKSVTQKRAADQGQGGGRPGCRQQGHLSPRKLATPRAASAAASASDHLALSRARAGAAPSRDSRICP